MYSSDMYVVESVAEATMNSAPMMGLFLGIIIFTIVLGLISIISNWKIFNKAGKHGWASIIPIYNYIVKIQIAKLSMIYLLLLIIPVVNIFVLFKINIEIAKKFGKSAGFGVGMTLFSIIFIPLLAFSDNTYEDNKVEISTDVNSNDNNQVNNISVEENMSQSNNINEINNIGANNTAPVINNEQNIITEQSIENNVSNFENEKIEEPVVVNEPIVNTEINGNISTMNEVPVMESVNVEPITQNVSETPNAFNSKPVDIITQFDETTNSNELMTNDVPIVNTEEVVKNQIEIPTVEQIDVGPIVSNPSETINTMDSNMVNSISQTNNTSIDIETENIQPIHTEIPEINNTIQTPEIKPQEIPEIPIANQESVVEQRKVCKNCGEPMPNIVSICPKCGTDNE